MAVIDWGENGGSTTREEDGTFSAERKFWAKVSTGTDRELDVELYAECPRRGHRHPAETSARCVSVNVTRRTPGNRLFDVTCSYSNRFDQSQNQQDNPLSRPPRISTRSIQYRIPFIKDTKGKYVVNKAGEPLEGAEREIVGSVISISKNFATWPDWIESYAMAMNADTIRLRGRVFAARTLKVIGHSYGDEEFEKDVRYFPLSIELQYNPLGWRRQFYNRGFYQLVGGGTVIDPSTGEETRVEKKVKKILDHQGNPFTEPQWLDKEGKWLPNPQPSQVVVLEFDDLEEKPFRPLLG